MADKIRPDIKQTPYWQDTLGPMPQLATALPRAADVVIIGSGYTGLNAARITAAAGRSTLVLDAGDAGFGCSTRNGGQISTSVKPTLAELTAKFGAQTARAIREEGKRALDWLGSVVEGEGFDCDFRRSGRFHAAHSPAQYETLVRDAALMSREEGIPSFAVPRAEQRRELGTDAYFGGVVFSDHCSVNPARLHRAFLNSVLALGVDVLPHCAALGIEKTGQGFRVRTEKGVVEARDVVVATNGYTGAVSPWLRRRVIPIGSYVIATEELPVSLVDELFPTDRIASDTCKVLYYYRASPDRRRILFGGRVSARETDTAQSGPLLYHNMIRIFPQLEGRAITHSWSGKVAYSFDDLAHTGTHDGVHYALGYCGSGVSMASYLGMRVGQKVLGLAEGQTAFDGLPHGSQPFYNGTPWFLPAAVAYYRWQDRREYRRALEAS
ncbi:NAD(P)/FAD-dependent oxidoreductase [Pseudooceanicola sp. 200-1SW]|uniref:NAD(P)/FAD-dependent oxidoreductase n=1 Tax=Pseudooceanicola sp. 200-1SW TaxID=3425949 RepID=UPI003D7FEF60